MRPRDLVRLFPLVQVKLLAFSQSADRLGFRERTVDCQPTDTPRQLVVAVQPGFDFENTRVAVNEEYTTWDSPIGKEATEVAIVPPVSGG